MSIDLPTKTYPMFCNTLYIGYAGIYTPLYLTYIFIFICALPQFHALHQSFIWMGPIALFILSPLVHVQNARPKMKTDIYGGGAVCT